MHGHTPQVALGCQQRASASRSQTPAGPPPVRHTGQGGSDTCEPSGAGRGSPRITPTAAALGCYHHLQLSPSLNAKGSTLPFAGPGHSLPQLGCRRTPVSPFLFPLASALQPDGQHCCRCCRAARQSTAARGDTTTRNTHELVRVFAVPSLHPRRRQEQHPHLAHAHLSDASAKR